MVHRRELFDEPLFSIALNISFFKEVPTPFILNYHSLLKTVNSWVVGPGPIPCPRILNTMTDTLTCKNNVTTNSFTFLRMWNIHPISKESAIANFRLSFPDLPDSIKITLSSVSFKKSS